jgi:hypothetical protein
MFQKDIATELNLDIGFVRVIADQLGWDSTWIEATDAERKIFDMLAKGHSLVDVRSALRVDFNLIAKVARRSGLDKKARKMISKGSVKRLDSNSSSDESLLLKHEEKWGHVRDRWDAGYSFASIQREFNLTTRQLIDGMDKMRILYGWFSARPEALVEVRKEFARRRRELRLRNKWKEANKLWKEKLTPIQIATALGIPYSSLRHAIMICQKFGMFVPITSSSRSVV